MPPKDTMHPQRKILSGKEPSACGMQTNTLRHLDPLPNERNEALAYTRTCIQHIFVKRREEWVVQNVLV